MLCAYIFYTLFIGGTLATERPIIGILSEEVVPTTYPNYSAFLPASYVKAVEQSGARVVPIFINKTEEYYRNVVDSVNGVLFPGGGLYFDTNGGYGDAGRVIVKYAKQRNDEGDHFPIFGVCLGFELLFYLDVESYDILGYCNATNVSLPLAFCDDFRNSSLYRNIQDDVIQALSGKPPVTYNYHKRCITKQLLNRYNLQDKWKVLSTSIDTNDVEFISTAEYYKYPIAGIQFHAEKIAYEWNPKQNIPHSEEALIVNRFFYDWLVREARKNNHSFKSSEEEDAALIYNYPVTYVNNYYEQAYLFK